MVCCRQGAAPPGRRRRGRATLPRPLWLCSEVQKAGAVRRWWCGGVQKAELKKRAAQRILAAGPDTERGRPAVAAAPSAPWESACW